MGNHCCALRAPLIKVEKSTQYITVVVAGGQGRVVEVEVPPAQASMKVGELLLEFPPAHFVAHFSHRSFLTASTRGLQVERASPLGADDDAMPGAAHVYVLFPMPRLHTRLTPQERLTFAHLLHNHMSDAQQDKFAKSAQALVPKRRSPAKQVCSFWGTRATRVAPELIPEQESTSLTTSTPEPAQVGGADDQQEEEELYTYTTHMKAKPWAPRLETITEGMLMS